MEKVIIDHSYNNRGGRIYRRYSMTLRLNIGGAGFSVVDAEEGFDYRQVWPDIETEENESFDDYGGLFGDYERTDNEE